MRVRSHSQAKRAIVLCGSFFLTAAIAHGQALSDADSRTLTDCRFIQDEHMRVACYDAVMNAIAGADATGEAAPKDVAPIISQSPPASQPAAQAAQAPASDAKADPTAYYGLPASRRTDQKKVGTIAVQVAEARLSPGGKLRIVATNGMIWDQSSGDPAKAPAPGTEVAISKGLMGGHWCQLDRWTSIRCERVDHPAEVRARPQEVPQREQTSSPPASVSASAAPSGTNAPAPSPAATTQPSDPMASYGLPQQENKNTPKKITVEVASTGLSATGKLRFVTTDGMVWEQTDGDPGPSPSQGSKVEITNGAMGSHWCQLDRWHSVRCERVE